jgi:sRNA-binding regulator protein Hfq
MIFRWASALLFLLSLSAVPSYGQKPGKPVPGRIHLLNGTTQKGQVVFVDYNKIKLVENKNELVYTPLEAASFVMAADSFVVLRDFKVAIGEDDQEYRIAFVKVGAVGPGFALYHFLGTMRREREGYLVGGSGMAMGQVEPSTKYVMSKAWFLKVASDPKWHSLPQTGTRLRQLVGPIIADDQKLVKSVNWEYVDGQDLQKTLLQYLANKKVAGK